MSDQRFYDEFVEQLTDPAYGRHHYERVRVRELERFLGRHRAHGTVVEVGCGAGLFAPILVCQARTYVAADLSTAMVRQARARTSEVARGCQLSAEKLPFSNGSVDLVVCSEVLEHVEDKRSAIEEFARITRPGGHLWLTTPNPGWRTGWMGVPAGIWVALRAAAGRGREPASTYHQDFDEWIPLPQTIGLLSDAGFTVELRRYLCPLVNPGGRLAWVAAATLGPLATLRTAQYYLVTARRRGAVASAAA